MRIVLLRHIKSDWSDSSLADIDRTVLKSRKEDVLKTIEMLKGNDIYPDLIFSSAAKRTMQTAKEVCKLYDFTYNNVVASESLYACSSSDLMTFIESIFKDSDQTVFIVGHNPSITDFANTYLKQEIENVPTSGAVVFTMTAKRNFKFELAVLKNLR